MTNYFSQKASLGLLLVAILLLGTIANPSPTSAQTTIDLTEYIAGASFIPHGLSTGEWIQFADGGAPGGVRQYKNSNYEQFIFNNSGIFRREDTSWAPITGSRDALCTNGNKAIYTLDADCNNYDEDQAVGEKGVYWAPNQATEGQEWSTGAHQIVTIDSGVQSGEYSYSLPPLNYCRLSNLTGYDHPDACNQTSVLKLTAHYEADEYTFCTGSPNPAEMIVIEVTNGPGSGDTFYFMKGWGLVGFEATGFQAGLSEGPGVNVGQIHAPTCDVQDSSSAPIQIQQGLQAYEPRDPELYNYFPLMLQPDKSLNNTGQLKDKLIWNLAYDQAYEVHCAAKEWRLRKNIWGALQRFFELYPGSVVELEGTGTFNTDASLALIPMFRGNELITQTKKTSSFEGFFGALNHETELNEISSGTANSLLDLEQQCRVKAANLSGVNQLCEKLEDPGSCSLNKEIQGIDPSLTTSTAWGLFGELDDAFSNHELSCAEFAANWKEEYSLPQKQFLRIQEALQLLPIDLDLLYRTAFLVLAPLQDSNEGALDDFWFLQSPPLNNVPLNAPLFISLKIPDFATNRSLQINSAKITTYLLRNKEQNDEAINAVNEQREGFLQDIAAIQNASSDSLILNCEGMPQCEEGTPEEVALKQAVVDMINGSGQTCGDEHIWEDAGDIFSLANISEDGRKYKDPFFSELLPMEDSQSFGWAFRVRESYARSNQSIIGPDGKKGVQVRAFLVAPLGIEYEQINKALKVFFNEGPGFDSIVAANCVPDSNNRCGVIPEYYPIKNLIASWSSSQPSNSFVDFEDVVCRTNVFGVEVCNPKTKQFSVSLNERDKEGPHILGAKLGWMIKKIQETLRSTGSKAFEYIKSCERTEDLFLGRCSGVPPGGLYNIGDTPVTDAISSDEMNCNLTLAADPAITQQVIANKQNYMNEITTTFPSTKITSDLFDWVVNESVNRGWNPAVPLALGREETAFGALGNVHIFGCMAGNPTWSMSMKEITNQQLDCLTLNFETALSCEQFMCTYSGDGNAPCIFNKNPDFPRNLPRYYEILVPSL